MNSDSRLKLSAIIICEYRVAELVECLDSLLRVGQSVEEVVLVLNGAEPPVREEAFRRRRADARVTIVQVPRRSPSLARNAGAARAKGDVLYFLDDDVSVRDAGVRALRTYFERNPDIAIAGAANLTPPDDPPFAQLSGHVLASCWGAGNTRARYTPAESHRTAGRDLITCNLAVRSSVFASGVRFPARFEGEEVVFLEQARQRGIQIGYCRDAWVYHRRRRTLRAYLVQVVRYGEGRTRAILTEPRTFHPLFLAPLGLVGYLLALPLLLALHEAFWAPAVAYAALTALASSWIAVRQRSVAAFFVLPWIFFLTHAAYAVGLLWGVVRKRFRTRSLAEKTDVVPGASWGSGHADSFGG